jgi:hypothetical protein
MRPKCCAALGVLFDKLIVKKGKRRRRSPSRPEVIRKDGQGQKNSGELCVSAITIDANYEGQPSGVRVFVVKVPVTQ